MGFLLQVGISGLVIGSIYALVALGYNVIFNATGGVSFAQGEFVSIGGFLAIALLGLGFPLVAAVGSGVLGGLVLSVVLERSTVRQVVELGPIAIGMVTIGQQIVLQTSELAIWGDGELSLPGLTGDSPMHFAGAVILPQSLWVLAGTVAAFVGLRGLYARTWIGRSMLACADDKEAAASLGINPSNVVMIAFALAGTAGALAGVLIAPLVAVYYQSGLDWALAGMSAAVVGGLGNNNGAIIAGLGLGLVQALAAAFVPSGLSSTVSFSLLILVLMFRPTGLLGFRRNAA